MKDIGQFHSLRSQNTVYVVSLLQACARQRDLGKGSKLHAYIREDVTLENDCYVASNLISMYARCGALAEAKQVLNRLPARDVVTWTTLLAGYIQHGKAEEALKCFDYMQHDSHFPDAVTFSCALKACGSIGASAKGEEIHDKIATLGMLEENSVLRSSLIDMYVRCGALAKAQQALNELPVQDVVTWNALLAGYAQPGKGKEGFKCFENMQYEGYPPNPVTFSCALKACGSIGAVTTGEYIHAKIASMGMLETNAVLGNSLVDMYARCGALAKMQQVFNKLPVQDLISWNILIAGYVQQGRGEEALKSLDTMQCAGHSPDTVTFTCALKACGSLGAVARGEKIHNSIVSLGILEKSPMLGNALIDMYVRCGVLAKTQQIFHELPVRNVVTWTALMTGYAEQGQSKEALLCFDNMQHEGHLADAITFTCALKACASMGAVTKGEKIHNKIATLHMLEKNIVLGNSLVDMYARCDALPKAQQVFHGLPVRDVVTWNALLAGFAQQGHGKEALKCFDNMQREGYFPDAVSFICALKACGDVGALTVGEQIHEEIASLGMLQKDIALRSVLVDMYARCGVLGKAQQVHNELPGRDIVTWNVLIAGYVEKGQSEEALKCFDSMQSEGHSPTIVTFMYALKACGNMGATTKGEMIHGRILSLGMLEKSIVLGSALVDMYAKYGELIKAQQVLNQLPVRDVVTWNALIVGHAQMGQGEEALKCFDSMQYEGHSPNVVSFTCALKACGSIGAAAKGEQIHGEVAALGMLEKNIVLGNTLVYMYAKYAALAKAQKMVRELPFQNVVTWTILVGGYAQKGQSGEALDCFARMLSKGLKPDSTTLVCVLNACSHSGLLDWGETIFSTMSAEYDIISNVEHFCCMIDLFGRAGNLNNALVMIEKMPSAEYLPVWLALLGACHKWRDVKNGRFAFERAVCLDKRNAAIYICMANIYGAAGM